MNLEKFNQFLKQLSKKGLPVIDADISMNKYIKIDLSEKNEPVIWKAIKHGSIIENVALDDSKTPDYSDTSLSENGRCCYPRTHIDDAVESNAAGEPETVIFLTGGQ